MGAARPPYRSDRHPPHDPRSGAGRGARAAARRAHLRPRADQSALARHRDRTARGLRRRRRARARPARVGLRRSRGPPHRRHPDGLSRLVDLDRAVAGRRDRRRGGAAGGPGAGALPGPGRRRRRARWSATGTCCACSLPAGCGSRRPRAGCSPSPPRRSRSSAGIATSRSSRPGTRPATSKAERAGRRGGSPPCGPVRWGGATFVPWPRSSDLHTVWVRTSMPGRPVRPSMRTRESCRRPCAPPRRPRCKTSVRDLAGLDRPARGGLRGPPDRHLHL